ncbi:MAG: phage virion morphogenesis protein [Rhodocyclales bacterium]|nr:phage virion morphogenesis protein [Rhodocyclales bacterium]
MAASITLLDAQVLDVLHDLMRKINNMTPVMDSIGQEMEAQVSDRFETQMDPMGVAWSPWANSTKAHYPEDGNGRVLDRYGDMLSSLGHQADSSSVAYGFAMPYAAYHEFSTKHMPRRGMLTADPEGGVLSPSDQAAVLDIIQRYLTP